MGLIPFARNAFCPVAADEAHRLSVVECYEFRAINEQLFGATYLLSEDSDKLVSVESLLDSLTIAEESWLSR